MTRTELEAKKRRVMAERAHVLDQENAAGLALSASLAAYMADLDVDPSDPASWPSEVVTPTLVAQARTFRARSALRRELDRQMLELSRQISDTYRKEN